MAGLLAQHTQSQFLALAIFIAAEGMACSWAAPRPSAAAGVSRCTLQSRRTATCIIRAPASSSRRQLLPQLGWRHRLAPPAASGRSARDWAPSTRDKLGWDASDDDYDTDEDLDLFPEEVRAAYCCVGVPVHLCPALTFPAALCPPSNAGPLLRFSTACCR